jgi:hypothetical protein
MGMDLMVAVVLTYHFRYANNGNTVFIIQKGGFSNYNANKFDKFLFSTNSTVRSQGTDHVLFIEAQKKTCNSMLDVLLKFKYPLISPLSYIYKKL